MPDPYTGECGDCNFYEPHIYDDEPTGYGSCSKHHSTQLKTPDDAAIIQDTPIVWHASNCYLGEPKE